MRKVFMIGFSENKGGVEKYIQTLSNNISKEKIEIVLSLPIMEFNQKKWIRPRNRHNYLKYYFFWRKFFKENSFDAIYYNTCDIVSIDMLKFAKKAGVPVRIIHSHSSNNSRKLNFWHKSQEQKNRKNLKKHATHCLACSKVAGDWMFGENTEYKIINNAIELSKFQYEVNNRIISRQKLGLKNELVIGMVGRLTELKNPEFGIKMFATLQKLYFNCILLVVGEGERSKSVQRLVLEYELQDKVRLLGRREDVASIMSAIDCFLMPSKFEGFPFAMVEAQAAGLPCVVSDNISRETDLTGNVHFISLEAPLEQWAQKIIEIGVVKNRECATGILKQKGYDINDNIQYVERILLNEGNL